MRKGFGISMVLALTVVSLTALAADDAAPLAKIGQTAPGFTLDNQAGKPVSLADYKGKIVVLEWINRECPFVQRHLKAKTMVNLAEKYKDKGVVWMAIDSTNWHNEADNAQTVAQNGLPYSILSDAGGSVGHEYGAKTTPDMFVINAEGTLVYSGAIDSDDSPEGGKPGTVNYVQQALEETLAGKSVTASETKSYGCGVKYK